MKVLSSTKYRFVDKYDNMYLFESLHRNVEDKEFVFVQQAKLVNPDGTCVYYNIESESAAHNYSSQLRRISEYASKISNYTKTNKCTAEQRVCLTQNIRPTHIPKRSDATSDDVVKTNLSMVNRRKWSAL